MDEAGRDDDLLLLDDGAQSRPAAGAGDAWRVLVVDDDEDVHSATRFALDKLHVLDRPIEFLHAYSSAEASRLLAENTDVAVILLDVVMERENAGLDLVRHIRDELKRSEIRIILRTGQPGYAPEIAAIRDYDINDYKAKSELTRNKLYTALTTALRCYDQIRAIDTSRRGLAQIVRGAAALMAMHEPAEFAAAVVGQLAELLTLPADAVVCAGDAEASASAVILHASGRFAGAAGHALTTLADARARDALGAAVDAGANRFDVDHVALAFCGRGAQTLGVYFATPARLSETNQRLVEVFCSNVSVCLDNVALFSRLHSFAYYDQLLSLPNRTRFVERVDACITEGQRETSTVALVDIDHFSEMNDAFGHRYGDQLLQAVARRLQTALAADVVLARIGCDTFGILGRHRDVAGSLLLSLFRYPFEIEGNEHSLSATIGLVALSEVDGSGIDAVKDAGIALKKAKSVQRGHACHFSREMGVEIRERVRLLHELRGAFESERLFLAYQPQIDLATGRVTGAEALLRWRNELGRFVQPDQFIPLAEYSGLIVSIGEWVLRTACHQQMHLVRAGYRGFRMAVNVSVAQFRHPKFLQVLDAAVADTGVDPRLIELEITESVAMLEAGFMIDLLRQIKARGFTIAVDDFGTGFSSLSYLQKLAIDRLKIDRSFINQMAEGGGGVSIAQMVIELGRNLQLGVIAEGVEDARQAQMVTAMGCREAQGFFYARPMDAKALDEWLCAYVPAA